MAGRSANPEREDTVTTAPAPRVVAVPDTDLAAAATAAGGTARLAARITASGAAAVAIGTDRFDPATATGNRLDPTAAALALGRALPEHGFLVAVAPTREHPYNVARRVLSLDHVLDGRVGVVVGSRDHGAPDTDPRDGPHDPVEFATVLRGLWRTWPLDSIVGDRASGVFARTERIRPLDHDGGPDGYRVRGPLTTPSSRQGEPVLAVWHDVDLPGGSGVDLVLGGAAHPLAPLPEATGGAEPHRASRQSTTRPTLRTLLGLAVPDTAAVTS